MISRYFLTILFMALPAILPGTDPEKPESLLNPAVPDTIKGIRIQFEVREVKVFLHGSPESIYCLCADITNLQNEEEKMLLRYECLGQARTKEIEIAGRQQKFILVDRCRLQDEIHPGNKYLFTLIQLECSQ
jgi:hypothetical protein